MYLIAICEDVSNDMKKSSAMVRAAMEQLDTAYRVDEFTNPAELLRAIDGGRRYHLLVLDIFFRGPEGISLAMELRNRQMDSSIIFISSSKDFVFQGYDIHAVSYILKPPDPEKLEKAIRYAYHHGPTSMARVALRHTDGATLAACEDILYMESARHYVVVHLADGAHLKCRCKLADLENEMPKGLFVRCHHSVCVNLHHIKLMQKDKVILSGEKELPISRTYREEFAKAYFLY